MNDLLIDTISVKDTVEALKIQLIQLEQITQNIARMVEMLNANWEGNADEQFVYHFKQKIFDYYTVLDTLNDFRDALDIAAERYKENDLKNMALIERI